jgi:hypothetical protein
MTTAPATGVGACPRCKGYVGHEGMYVTCLRCGWSEDLPTRPSRPMPPTGVRLDQHAIQYGGDQAELKGTSIIWRSVQAQGDLRDYVITCPYCLEEMDSQGTGRVDSRRWRCANRHTVHLLRGKGGWYTWS